MIFSSTPVWIPSVQRKSNVGFLPRFSKFLMPSPPACTLWKCAWKFPLIFVLFVASSLYGGWWVDGIFSWDPTTGSHLFSALCMPHVSDVVEIPHYFLAPNYMCGIFDFEEGKTGLSFCGGRSSLPWWPILRSLLCNHYTQRRGQQAIKSWRWKQALANQSNQLRNECSLERICGIALYPGNSLRPSRACSCSGWPHQFPLNP